MEYSAMIEWLGTGHLFELSRAEVVAGFFTPLVIFAVFFLAHLIMPGRRVPGYVINPETGEPRSYRLNGLLVFAVALVVWALELTGMPRDWFCRSSIYAVTGGTVFTTIFTIISVFSQPRGKVKSPLLALWYGRAQELSFFNERFRCQDVFLCRRGHDAGPQRPVRSRVPLPALRRELESGRLPVRGVLHFLRAGLLHLRARPAERSLDQCFDVKHRQSRRLTAS